MPSFIKRSIHIILIITVFAFVAAVIFHLKIKISNLNPFNTAWLLQGGDWSQHQLGWEFFRRQPWTFPIGNFDNFFYPSTANIGYTDSIPLLALFFKVFQPFLPEQFQYIGPWIFSCFVLQGLVSYKILRLYKFNTANAILGGTILQLTPALIMRLGHPALCAHWLILWAGYNYVYYIKYKANSWPIFIPIIIASFVHPYLLVMVLAIGIVTFIQNQNYLKRYAYPLLALIIVFVIWYVIGYFQNNATGNTDGLGYFSAQFTTLWNPISNSSLFLTDYPLQAAGQYEGYAYLGLGIYFLASYCLIIGLYRLIKQKSISIKPDQLIIFLTNYGFFLVIVAVFSSFAITQLEMIVYLQSLNNEFINVILISLGTFRSSGRFIWPLMYLIIISTIIFAGYITKRSLLLFVTLICVIALQISDISPLLIRRLSIPTTMVVNQQSLNNWQEITKPYTKIYMFPPYIGTYDETDDYVLFSYIAALTNKPVSTGYLARFDRNKAAVFSETLTQDLQTGNLDAKTIYIAHKNQLPIFDQAVKMSPELRSVHSQDNYIYIR